MKMDPAIGAQGGAGDDANASSNDAGKSDSNEEEEPAGKKRKTLADQKIEERKAANRKSALESRLRKKALITTLQQTVETLTNENKELRAVSQAMHFQLQCVMIENQQLRIANSQGIQAGALPTTIQQPNVVQPSATGIAPAGRGSQPTPVAGVAPGGGGMVQGSLPMGVPLQAPQLNFGGAIPAQPVAVSQPVNPSTTVEGLNGIPPAPTPVPDGQSITGSALMAGLGNLLPLGITPVAGSLPTEPVSVQGSLGATTVVGATNVPQANRQQTQETVPEAQV